MQRWLFQRELQKLANVPVYYLDECGVDHRLYREYGRAPRGERIYEEVCGKRRGRTSIIGTLSNGAFVGPMVYEGSCTSAVMDAYFKHVLLPQLVPGSVIILDNARFHQSPSTAKLVEEAGCRLLFLPAYSPDLNPIEHFWAKLKNHLREHLPLSEDPFLFISEACLSYC